MLSEYAVMERLDNFIERTARRVKRVREEQEMSREKLADLSGVSVSAIRCIEEGLNEPRMSSLLKVCRALRIDPAEVLGEAFSIRMKREGETK